MPSTTFRASNETPLPSREGQPCRVRLAAPSALGRTLRCALLLIALPLGAPAQEPVEVGVVEHLGERLPLDSFTFFDEQGKPVKLAELFDRPVVLTLVYYKCPGICTPLLQELVRVADLCDLNPGEDYRLITISFDPTENAELARLKKENMLATMEHKQVPPEGWRFMTGDADNIRRITEAVGFRYVPDKNKVDFVHAATLVFISSDGMIARYLNGTEFNPADLKLAVIDAKDGRARSFMQRIQKLCYAYDPEGRVYVLQVNRLILGVTLLFAIGFGVFLLVWKTTRRPAAAQTTGNAQ